jgi:flagellar biosynthesis/type III secretory pathway chaperone
MPPLNPITAEQVAEMKRLAQVLAAQCDALLRGESPQHHLAMADSLLGRLGERSRQVRMNLQLVRGVADEKHRGESWIYTRPQ